MTSWNTEELIAADKQFVWHPFTNMPEWCAPEHEPIVIVEGDGALLRQPWSRIHRRELVDLDKYSRAQSSADQSGNSRAVGTDRTFVVSGDHKSGGNRTGAGNS